MEQNSFVIKLRDFYAGFSPMAHLSSLTEKGNRGHASAMVNADILGETLTQGPGLANLTNGTEAGAVSELINHILDVSVAVDTTYGIGTTKLFKIGSAAVVNTGGWPKAITGCVAGKSVVYLKNKLYYFFNRSGDGAIGVYNLNETFNDAWQTGFEKATLMPSASKEDILIWGHGRYVGVYFDSTTTINKTRLDFGNNTEVADIVFHGNQWHISVNSGSTGRNYAQIYSYAGGATTALLSDEASVGLQKIGFLFPLNGVVYVAYSDLSFGGGYKIGYLAGRKIEPLVHFSGSLPTYAQKTLFKNTILFLSGSSIYSAGAIIGELPFAISQLASGGYATCGAIASPFGTPMVASTNNTNYRLAKFSGYSTASSWRGIVIPTVSGKLKGYIDFVVVRTPALGAGARCDLKLEFDDAATSTLAKSITGSKKKHIFEIAKECDNFRVFLDWSEGSATNPCLIKEIQIWGHYK